MGKTSLFGRRASKVPSDRGSPTNSQGSGEERKKKTSRDKSQPRTEAAGQKPKLLVEKEKKLLMFVFSSSKTDKNLGNRACKQIANAFVTVDTSL